MRFNFRNIQPYATIRTINMCVLLFILAFLAYILFAPLTPARFKSLTVRNANHLEAGGTLTYDIDRCRYVTENVQTQIVRNLVAVDKQGHPLKNIFSISLSSDVTATPRGCGVQTRSVLLPANIPTGYYKLKIISTYSIIPARKPTVVQISSQTLTIQPPTLEEQIEQLNQQLQLLQKTMQDKGTPLPASIQITPLTSGTAPRIINSSGTTARASPSTATSSSSPQATAAPAGGSSSPAATGSTGGGNTGSSSGGSNPLIDPIKNIINQIQDTGGLDGIL